jgi:hypothetical protein
LNQPRAALREKEAQPPAQRRQQQTFGEQLADQPKPSRTQCVADGEFPLTRSGAGEQQAGNVGAGNQ